MSAFHIFSLTGRTALVTGASSGIGLHIARTMAQAGARVALAARRVDRLEAAAMALRSEGHQAIAVPMDLMRPQSFEVAWEQAELALGAPIDILFNNAGILYAERFLEQQPDRVAEVFDTDLKGPFLLAQLAARRMADAGGGAIINVASTAGLRAGGSMSSYGAAKAGLIHLTRVMALELAGRHVRVNVLCPGNLKTDMHAAFEEKGFADAIRNRIPQRRFGTPQDLDGAVLLLASEAGGYITGIALPVDGGQVLAWM